MEQGESVKDSVIREYQEETGLHLKHPELKGVFTFVNEESGATNQEWMMFTFLCDSFEGRLVEHCDEGVLEWVALDEILEKPMAEGDRSIYKHILQHQEVLYGTFTYTPDYQLINSSLDPSIR